MPDDPPTPFGTIHRRALRGARPLTLGRLVLLPPEPHSEPASSESADESGRGAVDTKTPPG